MSLLPNAGPPAACRARPRFGKAARWNLAIVVTAAALTCLLWIGALERIAHERKEAVGSIVTQNSNLAIALEEHTVRTLKSVDQALLHVAREYRRAGSGLDIPALVRSGEVDGELFHAIGILDRTGHLVTGMHATPGVDLSDREYFTAVRDAAAGRSMHVARPVVGRVTGKWSMHVSRRLARADGSFDGVVFGALDPQYFTSFYQRAELGRNGLVNLVGLDGVTRARRTGVTESFGQDRGRSSLIAEQARAPVGNFVTRGEQEGAPRFQSYRTLAEYGLIVAVGTSVEESLATFNQRRRYYIATSLVLTLMIGAFAALLMRGLASERRSLRVVADSEARFRAMFSQAAAGIALTSPDGRVIDANLALCAALGYSREELIGMPIAHLVDPDEVPAMLRDRDRLARGEVKSIGREQRYLRKDGSTGWANRGIVLVRGAEDEEDYYVSVFQDVSERKKAEEQLRLSAKAFASLADGIMVTDAARRLVFVNEAFSTITGYAMDDVLGRTPGFLHSGKQDSAFYEAMWEEVTRTGHWRGEVWDRRRNGEIFPQFLSISAVKDDAGAVTHYVGVCTDISSLKEYEAKLHHQAHHDALTGLPNRVLFQTRFAEAIARAKRHSRQCAMLFLDLDRFKSINDSLGHGVGDLLLQAVAKRLSDCVREVDTVSRFGGDEFAVLLDSIEEVRDAATVAQKLLDAMARPFRLEGHEFFTSASIGITCYPQDGTDIEALLKNADTAMYRAKADGRSTYQFFSADMNARALENLLLATQLRLALERGELLLHYQPRYNLTTGRVEGAEALARWQHPELGAVPPGRFIPIAEESGLIELLGEWVLRAACRQMRAWRDAGVPLDRVAVNLSPRQFRNPDLLRHITGVLEETGLPAGHLELEVTESMLMTDAAAAARALSQLKAAGATIAIDDFGTGYSSLSYLKRFPIDYLKIDKSFVEGVPGSSDDAAIVRAIIALAQSLGMKLIAEGVETDAQKEFLRSHGCHEGQGFLFSVPVSPEELPALLRAAPHERTRPAECDSSAA